MNGCAGLRAPDSARAWTSTGNPTVSSRCSARSATAQWRGPRPSRRRVPACRDAPSGRARQHRWARRDRPVRRHRVVHVLRATELRRVRSPGRDHPARGPGRHSGLRMVERAVPEHGRRASGRRLRPRQLDADHVDGDVLVLVPAFQLGVQAPTSDRRSGVDTGEVVWKLGGRDSDFTFPAGDVGPFAQHTARELPNGNIQMFDNGSATFDQPRGAFRPGRPDRPSCGTCSDQGGGVRARRGRRDGQRRAQLRAGHRNARPVLRDLRRVLTVLRPTVTRWSAGAAETKALSREIDAHGDLLLASSAIPAWPAAFPLLHLPRATRRRWPDADRAGRRVSPLASDGHDVRRGRDTSATGLACTDRGGSSLADRAWARRRSTRRRPGRTPRRSPPPT